MSSSERLATSRGGLRILAEEMLARVLAAERLAVLVFAVDGFHHQLAQLAVGVAREQRIPVAAPDGLDDVPAGAAEVAFQLLDDLAVAAHRAVEALQVAVDDEDQVVEAFAAGDAKSRRAIRARRFRRRRGSTRPCGRSSASGRGLRGTSSCAPGRSRRSGPGPSTRSASASNRASATDADTSSAPRPSTSMRKWSSCDSLMRPSRNERA